MTDKILPESHWPIAKTGQLASKNKLRTNSEQAIMSVNKEVTKKDGHVIAAGTLKTA